MSAPKMTEVEIYLLVDENGEAAVGLDAEAATDRYTEDVGDLSAVCGFRMVKVKLTVPLPVVVELAATVPDLPAPGPLTLAVS